MSGARGAAPAGGVERAAAGARGKRADVRCRLAAGSGRRARSYVVKDRKLIGSRVKGAPELAPLHAVLPPSVVSVQRRCATAELVGYHR